MLIQGPNPLLVTPLDEYGNFRVGKQSVKDDLTAFLSMGFKNPVIVAALSVTIEFDDIVIGDVVRIDHIQFRFLRHKDVPARKYWLMSEDDHEAWIGRVK